jgi:chromosome partitioning protein
MNWVFGSPAINSVRPSTRYRAMLDWLKRIAAPVPRKQLAANANPTLATEEKVEQLVGRFDKPITVPFLPERLVTTESQARSSDENVERLSDRLATSIRAANELVRGSTSMRIIAVASQKGGSGKTTIAAHLAVQASMSGQGRVVVVDTDPQGSLTEWWDARRDDPLLHNEDALGLATVKLDDLAANLLALRMRGAAVVIIDTPPALTASIQQVIGIADLVLIPTRPSPHDLRAVGATVSMVRRAGKPFFFVINGAAPRANITAEAVAALSEHGRVVPPILYQRTDFAASMIDGGTVMETAPTGRSAQAIAELWKQIYAQLSLREAA